MKLIDTLLENDDQKRGKLVTNLEDIRFSDISRIFGKKMFGHNVPNPSDSSTVVNSEESLNRWKSGIREKYGNVMITLDNTGGVAWHDQIKINDEKFIADKESYSQGKANWLSQERQAGRTSGLD